MLDTFMPGSLPGEASDIPTLRSDISTFNSLWEMANSIFNLCVKKPQPMAGWSYAGMSNSIGWFDTIASQSLTYTAFERVVG